jgi:energy-coupling factor transporter ATP-binding protein EcfA2
MQISTFQLQNYKSYRDSGELQFSSGFNVLVGQNNAGKSSLLESLSLNFIAKPHRSLITLPRTTSTVNPSSSAKAVLSLTGEELKDLLLSLEGPFFVPVPSEFRGHGVKNGHEALMRALSLSWLDLQTKLVTTPNNAATFTPDHFPSHGLYHTQEEGPGRVNFYVFNPNNDRTDFTCAQEVANDTSADFGLAAASYLRERIYSFKAQRFNLGVSQVGTNNVLKPDASNLPEVLSILQGSNPNLFAKFNEYVRQIFPTVYLASVRNIPDYKLEVIIWTENPASQRDDLAVPLAESGTGIGQVLAILYVVLTSRYSRTILIDEPNSFLHPAAARKLIEILKLDFSQHQYIVATHSPEIIKTTDPSTLFMVRMDGRESKLERLDSNDVKDQGRCLLEVGARLSDVFGSDEIVWVEGDTEEICFGLIVRDLLKRPLLGRAIVPVRNVGELEGKRHSARVIWDIYSQLTQSNALVPPAIAFVFDKEQRTEKEQADLIQRSNGKLKFLSRRMYENYLLVPQALQATLLTLPSFQNTALTAEEIQEWLERKGGTQAYLDKPIDRIDVTSKSWLENVHGAKILQDLFAEFSQNREEYRKTLHSVQLTEWLIQHNPSSLDELKTLLASILIS